MFDIKRFKKDFKMTQDDIAELLGCSQSLISKTEKLKLDLSEKYIAILSEQYGEEEISAYIYDIPSDIEHDTTEYRGSIINERNHIDNGHFSTYNGGVSEKTLDKILNEFASQRKQTQDVINMLQQLINHITNNATN